MDEKNTNDKVEYENILGNGYEPLAVTLMLLFMWLILVSLGSKFLF